MTSTASASNSHSCETFTFTLPPLPYEYTALEPIVDTQTMEIHHQQHHNTYVNNLNKIIKGQPEVSDIFAVFDLIRSGKGGDAMRNNGGGHYNHALFWKWMTPSDSLRNVGPSSELLGKIVEKWTSFEEMQNKFNDAALTRFGSGWAWLGVKPDGELEITSTPNQDNPLMDRTMIPILGLDVWEHAYYLKHQNRRMEYIKKWWDVVNWDTVNRAYADYASKNLDVPMDI